MIVLFKENDKLLVKCKVNLKKQVPYQNKVFRANTNNVQYLSQEEVVAILTVNGNVRIWNGVKFIKINLGQFVDIINKNQYKVELKSEFKKETPKHQPKPQQQPEVKKEAPKPQQQPEVKKEAPVVSQPELEVNKENEKVQEDENKKKRHNNNKNQGGEDK